MWMMVSKLSRERRTLGPPDGPVAGVPTAAALPFGKGSLVARGVSKACNRPLSLTAL